MLYSTDYRGQQTPAAIDGEFWRGLVNWVTDELGGRKFLDAQRSLDFLRAVDDEAAALKVLLGTETVESLLFNL